MLLEKLEFKKLNQDAKEQIKAATQIIYPQKYISSAEKETNPLKEEVKNLDLEGKTDNGKDESEGEIEKMIESCDDYLEEMSSIEIKE